MNGHGEPSTYSVPAGVAVGKGIPADVPHAVSVSLPRWQDNIDYEEGRLTELMETGYPRFFIHRSIQKLAAHVEMKFAQPHESCLLLPTAKAADSCRLFMQDQHSRAPSKSSDPPSPLSVRIVQFCLVPSKDQTSPGRSTFEEEKASANPISTSDSDPCSIPDRVSIYIVLFPKNHFPLAKAFWQHTGDGISSRLAVRCLQILADTGKLTDMPEGTTAPVTASPAVSKAGLNGRPHFRNRHYARSSSTTPQGGSDPNSLANSTTSLNVKEAEKGEQITNDLSLYVEERYGRNLPLSSASLAKRALRRRIAGTLLADRQEQAQNGHADQSAEESTLATGETMRVGTGVTEEDVYLYPTGMSAIFHAHQVAMLERKKGKGDGAVGKSICFGFPYTDTLKILQKWGPGCHHLGNGTDADIDELERLLEGSREEEPILALFCEFPSNPLLRSPNLARLRNLADKHGFLIVVDETIGNFVNVEVLPYSDIVVSSLTKVFSGDTNVMGGSFVLNPDGPKAKQLREALAEEYEDSYWGEDAVFMERNSRDFIARVERINENAEALCEMLLKETQRPEAERVIKKVQYPKYETREHYDRCRRKTALLADSGNEGGYGGLFSILFASEKAATTFYDNLSCAKGPSLGTNFTLASPYAILAHYTELDWAAQFGVEKSLIRVSVGLEKEDVLLDMFSHAADKAREAVAALR